MGFVRAKGLIGSSKEKAREIEFLVDSGSFYTVVPPELAKDLDLATTTYSATAILADRREVNMPLALAYLQLLQREGVVMMGIMDVPVPLLGVSALETLGLKINPMEESLEYSRPFGPIPLL